MPASLSKTHQLFGYAGLIPFIGLAVLQVFAIFPPMWLLSYAALIFSFLGGLLWFASMGASSANSSQPKHVAWMSIAVMLWAWLWLVCEPIGVFVLAGLSFIALHVYERIFLSSTYTKPFMRLRLHLTCVASTCLIASDFLAPIILRY